MSKLDRLELQAKRGDFEILYIALPTSARSRIAELIDRLADTTVSVYMVPNYFTTSLFHGKWSSLEGIPLISVYDTPFWGADGWVKRAEDVVFSSLILLVIAIPMLLLAAAVKLSSPGPVLFTQRRYGMDGKEISVWKFRTMRACEDGDKVPQAKRNDPRATKLGAFLRRTSLDELPQFMNVLLGDMSIVGPRPHAVAHNELYRKQVKGYMLRHKVRPGITGWAQINGWRGETDTLHKMEKRVEHDLWYMRNWSLWLDLKIVLLTGVRGFAGASAY
jgi:putative colanic acid biosynthesis UDP-glucose lipid carrier transferase